jgi:uncharacterized protein YjbI with pentapeptide repeats
LVGGVDLRGVDLGGVDLGGVDLGGVDLGGVDLSGVDLSGVDLYRLLMLVLFRGFIAGLLLRQTEYVFTPLLLSQLRLKLSMFFIRDIITKTIKTNNMKQKLNFILIKL